MICFSKGSVAMYQCHTKRTFLMQLVEDDAFLRMRTEALYPTYKAELLYDGNGNVRRWPNGNPKKSDRNDVINAIDHICLDRAIYIDKKDGLIGQIRSVFNTKTGYNPYNDQILKYKICTKEHVQLLYPDQLDLVHRTIAAGKWIYHQQDTFQGSDDNGVFKPPKTVVYQAQIIGFEGNYMLLKHV